MRNVLGGRLQLFFVVEAWPNVRSVFRIHRVAVPKLRVSLLGAISGVLFYEHGRGGERLSTLDSSTK